MKLILFLLAFCLILFAGCFEKCYDPPELYFKPINPQGSDLVGSNGIYALDSIRLFLLKFNESDTSFVDMTNTSSFSKSGNTLSISLRSEGDDIFFLRYSYQDHDTLRFVTQSKKHPKCYQIDFYYNSNSICADCNNSVQTITK